MSAANPEEARLGVSEPVDVEVTDALVVKRAHDNLDATELEDHVAIGRCIQHQPQLGAAVSTEATVL